MDSKPASSFFKPNGSRWIYGAIVVVGAIAVVAVLLLAGGDNGGESQRVSNLSPRLVGEDDLREHEELVGHPVYWLGEPSGELEMKEDKDGSVYLRYLPTGAKAGDERTAARAVATYLEPDAVRALRGAAKRERTFLKSTPDGKVVLLNSATAVYFAYPDEGVEVQVFDPKPAAALRSVLQGNVVPVGDGP